MGLLTIGRLILGFSGFRDLKTLNSGKSCDLTALSGVGTVVPFSFSFAGLPSGRPVADPQFRQATANTQRELKEAREGLLATVIQSRSTNSLAYNLAINNDGSATAVISGVSSAFRSEPSRSQVFSPGTIDATTLRRLLIAIGDVSKIPTGSRMKSASFGTRTQIEYANRTSGDLQSIPQHASDGDSVLIQVSRELRKAVQTTLSHLGIDDRVRIAAK